MKKGMGVVLAGVLFVLSFIGAKGEDTTAKDQAAVAWNPILSDDFSSNNSGLWPTGADGIAVRSIENNGYKWSLTTSQNEFSWVQIPAALPTDGSQIRYSAIVALPYNSPYACAGFLLNGQKTDSGTDFYSFLICNDSTYGLMHNQNGTWSDAISFKSFSDFNPSEATSIQVEVSSGWANFYGAGKLLDTYNVGESTGFSGLFVQPLSSVQTDVTFSKLEVDTAPASEENSAENSQMDANVPDDFSRIIKMLQLKGRIDSIGGTYSTLPDVNMSLAQMGYQQINQLGIDGSNLIIQADIAWKSAYEKPDYVNSGCGFVLHYKDDGNYLRVYTAMDGNIYFSAYRNGTEVPIMTYNYGTWNVDSSGTLTVCISGSYYSIIYNQNLLGTVQDATWAGSGKAGTILKSGTNLDFGTSCAFTNMRVYQFQ